MLIPYNRNELACIDKLFEYGFDDLC